MQFACKTFARSNSGRRYLFLTPMHRLNDFATGSARDGKPDGSHSATESRIRRLSIGVKHVVPSASSCDWTEMRSTAGETSYVPIGPPSIKGITAMFSPTTLEDIYDRKIYSHPFVRSYEARFLLLQKSLDTAYCVLVP